MSKKSEILQFLLPDLLGKPSGMTDKGGNMIFKIDIPPDNYIFFIPIEKWEEYKTGKSQEAGDEQRDSS